MSTTTAIIPKRASYKASDVCELVGIEPYVLRSWTEEFSELGKTKSNGNARVFRYQDVQLALRVKHLLFTEGLTLGGARRKLDEEQETARVEADTSTDETPVVAPSRGKQRGKQLRLELATVKKDLKALLHMLSNDGLQKNVDKKKAKERKKAGR